LQKDGSIKDRIDVPEERKFVGFDAYKQVIGSRRGPGDSDHASRFPPDSSQAAVEANKHVFMEKAGGGRRAGRPFGAGLGCRSQAEEPGGGRRLAAHHQYSYLETIKQIHDGVIGDIVSSRAYWNNPGVWVRPKQPDWTEMNTRCETGTTSTGSAAITFANSTFTTWM